MKKNKDYYKDFEITSLNRQDFEDIGFNPDELNDEDMEHIARKLGDVHCGDRFWSDLEFWAEHFKLPKIKK